MKKSLIILFALASLVASMQDSFTLLVFKINQDYIAKNLCVQKEVENNTCQGCCHLKKQLEKQTEQEKSNPNPSREKMLIDFFPIDVQIIHPNPTYTTIHYKEAQCRITKTFLVTVFRPPKFRMI